MTATTVAPSAIEGIDMESVPKCEAEYGQCAEPATAALIAVPCGHRCLMCAEHLPQLRFWLLCAFLPRCRRCKTNLTEPRFTVCPL